MNLKLQRVQEVILKNSFLTYLLKIHPIRPTVPIIKYRMNLPCPRPLLFPVLRVAEKKKNINMSIKQLITDAIKTVFHDKFVRLVIKRLLPQFWHFS
jgi:hypothetical protein